MGIDFVPKRKSKCPEFKPRVMGSSECKCGHDLYSHYMCGAPNESRCLACGFEEAAAKDGPQRFSGFDGIEMAGAE